MFIGISQMKNILLENKDLSKHLKVFNFMMVPNFFCVGANYKTTV